MSRTVTRIRGSPVARAGAVANERHGGEDYPAQDDRNTNEFERLCELIDERMELISHQVDLFQVRAAS
jgi:hypothetical protein